MLRDFKQFLLRGNVVDLAVGIVIGAAFTSVITALVRDLLTPLIGAIFGKRQFEALYFTVNNSVFAFGDLLNQVIAFVLVGAALFFLVVKPVNWLVTRAHHQPTPDPATHKCPECLSEIPTGARRCAYCTAPVAAT